MKRYKLTIAYDGTAYQGWQRQPEPAPTIQRELEKAVSYIVSHPVTVQGVSRTDTGVHAQGQVAAMTLTPPAGLEAPEDLERLRKAINSRLPPDILIRRLEETSPNFDVRSAQRKRYRYLIWADQDRPIRQRHYVYHYYRPLNFELMQTACAHFIGTHDFNAFRGQADPRDNTTRTIFNCHILRRPLPSLRPHIAPGLPGVTPPITQDSGLCTQDPALLIFAVEGSGFLYHMVRTMVGTLLEIGTHKRPPDSIPQILASKDRQQAGPTAPAVGLCLQWIRF